MILYLAGDLLWASKIKAEALAAGVTARPVRTPAMLEERLSEGGVRALIVDLDRAEEAMAMLGRVRGPGAGEIERALRVVAYGAHTDAAALRAAREAGADEVLTRGQMQQRLPELVRGLAAGA